MAYRVKCELLTAATPALLKVALDAFLAGTSTSIKRKWTNDAGTQCLLFYYKYFDETLAAPVLCITFDNGVTSQFTVGYPLLTAQGVPATFFVTSNLIGTAGYMTWANLLTLQAAGHDIQCHTHTHTNLTTLTDAQIITEYTNVNNAFIGAGLPAPNHTAYPNGDQDARVRAVTATMRLTGRNYDVVATPWFSYPQFRDLIRYNYISWLIDDAGYSDPSRVYMKLDQALVHKSIVLTHGHEVGAAGGINTTLLNYIIDFAQANGFQILTVSQMYALLLT